MKGYIATIICLLFIGCGYSCKIIEGDLYFSFIRIGSLYNLPNITNDQLDSIFNSIPRTNADNNFYEKYKILSKENLLNSPFIELKLDNDSVITLYLNKNDYDKIKINKVKDLQANFKKIRVKANCRYLGFNLYKCENFIEMKKIDGQTLINSRKLKIEDYQ